MAEVMAVLAAALTLAATLLGGGGAIVPLEDAVQNSGYVLSTMLFLTGCVWTVYTSWALIKLSMLTGEQSYEMLGQRMLGTPGAVCIQVLIIVNSLLICVCAGPLLRHDEPECQPFCDGPHKRRGHATDDFVCTKSRVARTTELRHGHHRHRLSRLCDRARRHRPLSIRRQGGRPFGGSDG